MTRRRFKHRFSCELLLLYSILLSYFPVLISGGVVTLDSIEISQTHEWIPIPSKPTIYFQCKGENKTDLPDVKEKHVLYTFRGEESWQPLTEFPDKKCKRCGLYEKDAIKADYVFDEWELCPIDFTGPGGRYIHSKDEEFNATFLCPECAPSDVVPEQQQQQPSKPVPEHGSNSMDWRLIVIISVLASLVFIIVIVVTCKYCQRRKRQQDQARFLRLFEEGDDDLEDELGIGPLNHSI